MSQNETSPKDAATSSADGEKKWGRVLLCGGIDWANLGRKERKGGASKEEAESTDLREPHILRALANVRVTSIHASGASCHFVALDFDGAAWMFGRNSPTALGRCDEDEEGVIPETNPRRLTAEMLGAPRGTTFVHAAVGRGHTLLVGSNGDVWSAGVNPLGQCGQPPAPQVTSFTLMRHWPGETKPKIVKAAAGVSFSVMLSEEGKLYVVGSGEHGQLGNGRTGEHIATGNKTMFDVHSEPILIKAIQDKVITDVSCGHQHTIALDKDGFVYVWGYNGYCRLGLGNQQDVLAPKLVPQFAGPNELTRAALIAAGPSNSAVVDRQKMYWMAGKWKNTGEGSSGSPYSSFRYMQDIMGCKVYFICSGGVTHWGLAPDDDGTVMTIAWGQAAANSELGLGADEPKSATKPQRHQPLIGVDLFQIAAGQNTTFFLASPNEKLSNLPRHPEEVEAPDVCVVCNEDKGDDDPPLECEKCDFPYHLGCLNPPLSAVPDGEWFCRSCSAPPGSNVSSGARSAKRGREEEVDEEEDDEEEDDVAGTSKAGRKRKGAEAAKSKAPKRKR